MNNKDLEGHLLAEQQAINRQLEISFDHIVGFLRRMAGMLENEELQGLVLLDHRDNPNVAATISECITPYCIISLGADDNGYFNIVYSLDYRASEMIGEYNLSYLLRAIYRYTMIETTEVPIEQRIRLHSLALDVIKIYNNLI